MGKCIWELKCEWERDGERKRERAALRLIKWAEGRECSEEKPSLGRDWGNDGKKDLVYPPSLHPLLSFSRYWAGVRVPAVCVCACVCPCGGFHSSRLSWLYLLYTGAQTPLYRERLYVQHKPQPDVQPVLGKLPWNCNLLSTCYPQAYWQIVWSF